MNITNEKFQENLTEIIEEMNNDLFCQLEECENPLGIITLQNGKEVKVWIKVSRDI